MARTTLEKWIADAITDPDKDGRKLTQITLVHMQGGHQQVELHTFKFKLAMEVTPTDLANMFRGKAETYSQDLDGRQMFQLLAYYNQKEPEARHPFVIAAKAIDMSTAGLMTEPPDATGQAMQNMRHKENAHTSIQGLIGQVYARQQAMDNHAVRMVEQQAAIINQLTAENFNNFGMIKDLIFQLADNGHKYKMEEVKAEQAAKTRSQLLGLVPALTNSLTGREVFPQSTEDTAIIEAVVDNVSEEQIQTLMSLGLPDVILGPLANRIAKAMAKRREAEEARAALPRYKGSASDDVGGGTP